MRKGRFFMKKHLGLLGVTLLSAAVFAHAKPVQAVAGPTWMEPDDMFLKKLSNYLCDWTSSRNRSRSLY